MQSRGEKDVCEVCEKDGRSKNILLYLHIQWREIVVYRYVNVGRCSLVMAMGKAVIQRVIPLLIVKEVVFHKIPLGNAGGR